MVSIKIDRRTSETKKKINGKVNSTLNELLKKDIKLFSTKFGDKKKELFFSELHLMLSSGLELNNALLIVKDFFHSETDTRLVASLQARLSNGSSFYLALLESKSFSSYDCFSVRIGEETGQLEIILQELSSYYFKKVQLRRQFISALIYPAIVFGTAILAIVFMMNFVIPMFAGVFGRFNTELPYLTRVVIRLSEIVRDWSFPSIILLVLFYLFYMKFKERVFIKKSFSYILLKIPFLGTLLIKLYMARFCQSMKLLLSSKVHILDALNLSSQMVGFYPLDSVLPLVQSDVTKGELLSAAVSKYKIFDIRFQSMVKVGEEVNQLHKVFGKLEENYSKEVEHQTKVLTSMLEPLLILFLGLFVGVILVAMYLPMFKLGYDIK